MPVALAVSLHAVLVFAYRPIEARALPETAPVVIVLDAGQRFERGVHLVREGRADWIHFSAGEGAAIAERYAARARALLPQARITTESRSLSTLQNAYFTREELGAIPPEAILVTDSWHLFRAWLCFRWAGAGPLHLAPASDLDLGALPPGRVLREVAALWVTLGRIVAFSGLRRLGLDPDPGLLA